MSRVKEGQRCLRRLVIVLTTSTLMTGVPSYPGMSSLRLIPGQVRKDQKEAMLVTITMTLSIAMMVETTRTIIMATKVTTVTMVIAASRGFDWPP